MPPAPPDMPSHDQHTHRLLSEIEVGTNVSQRSLARTLGIALGLTNLLLRRLIRKGWVRMIHIKPNRVSYFLTPVGLAEKARMSRAYLERSVKFYAEARDRISERFAALSAACSSDQEQGLGEKRIVFYGTGEVAEIGYICLQETDLRLIGVVDDKNPRPRFFNVSVYPAADLNGREVNGIPFDRIVVMSFDAFERTALSLRSANVPHDRVYWL